MQSQSVDDILRVLADERRRSVLRYLVNHSDGVASYQELVEHVTSRHQASPTDVLIDLHHTMLPMMAERDFLEYDAEREIVRYQSNTFVEEVLNVIEDP